MTAFVVKYVHFVCVAVFFDSVKCEYIVASDLINSETVAQQNGCIAVCINEDELKTLEHCHEKCVNTSHQIDDPNSFKVKLKDNYKYLLELVCRDQSSLTINIYAEEKPGNIDSDINMESIRMLNSENKKSLYVVQVEQEIGKNAVKFTSMTISLSPTIKIERLKSDAAYHIKATVVNAFLEIYQVYFKQLVNGYEQLENTAIIETLAVDFEPEKIKAISVSLDNIYLNEYNLLDAVVEWTPSDERTCLYEYYYHRIDSDTIDTHAQITVLENPYSILLRNLTFNTDYKIALRGLNPQDELRHPFEFKRFTTDHCLNVKDVNVTMCGPFKPTNLNSTSVLIEENIYTINVTWQEPEYQPAFYILELLEGYYNNVSLLTTNLSGDLTGLFIKQIEIKEMSYGVTLTSHLNGRQEIAKDAFSLQEAFLNFPAKYFTLANILYVAAPILAIILIATAAAIYCICKNRRAKFERIKQRIKMFEDLEQKAPLDPDFDFKSYTLSSNLAKLAALQDDLDSTFFNDRLEMDKENVKILEILGEGAFGFVRKAILLPSGEEVAVKMLKDLPSVDDIKCFYSEIKVMKSVKKHPNIVGIVGHCTKDIMEMMLLTEYCSEGNLLNLLRNIWEQLGDIPHCSDENEECPPQTSPKLLNQKSSECVFNLDTSMIDKKPIKYKNIHDTSSINSYYVIKPSEKNQFSTKQGHESSSPTLNINSLIFNKLYSELNNDIDLGSDKRENRKYSIVCTNSCKCHVNIITNNNDDKTNNGNIENYCKIQVNDCECNVVKPKMRQPANTFCIENQGYEKNFHKQLINNDCSTYFISEKNTKHCHSDTLPKERGDNTKSNASAPQNDHLDDQKRIEFTSRDLISFAEQIAKGMEFLSHNKIVHRDLAARNVLVCNDLTVKIADFGLSRDIYQENMYKKSGNGKLPLKWLALESMTHLMYTSQSDVWSFGILLYEIVTFGGTPYPSVHTNNLVELLKSGYRMEKPKMCNNFIYDLMLSCWHAEPTERPTFSVINKKLNYLLSSTDIEKNELFDKIYLIKNTQKAHSASSCAAETSPVEPYLKPIS